MLFAEAVAPPKQHHIVSKTQALWFLHSLNVSSWALKSFVQWTTNQGLQWLQVLLFRHGIAKKRVKKTSWFVVSASQTQWCRCSVVHHRISTFISSVCVTSVSQTQWLKYSDLQPACFSKRHLNCVAASSRNVCVLKQATLIKWNLGSIQLFLGLNTLLHFLLNLRWRSVLVYGSASFRVCSPPSFLVRYSRMCAQYWNGLL